MYCWKGHLIPEVPDVVREPDEEEEKDECDPDRGDALVDLPSNGSATGTFDDRERDVTTVEREQRKQVEQRQREAQQPEHPEVRLRAALERLGRSLDDPDRARDLLAAALDESPE